MTASIDIRRSICALTLALAAVALGPTASAQTPDDLLGEWAASCDGFGAGAACSLVWEPGLHADLMTVRYEVRSRSGARLFAGQGVYRDRGEDFEGAWSDTNGFLHPLQATFADGALVTHWGKPETERGRTRYQLTADGGLAVTDWVLTGAGWREFSSASYSRTTPR